MKIGKPKANFFNLTSFIFTVLVSSGFYGFGRDFLRSYSEVGFIPLDSYIGALGWNIAATTLWGFALGPLISAFFLSISIASLFRCYLKPSGQSEKFLMNSSYLALIHSWPVILPILNVIRQGLATGPFYLIVSLLDQEKNKKITNKKNLLLFSALFILPLFHKLGLSFILLSLIVLVILSLDRVKRRLYIIIASILLYYSIILFSVESFDSRTIGYNIAPLLLIIATAYCFFILLSKKKEILEKYIFLVPYFMNIASIAYLRIGFLWQFERLQMSVLIPQMIAFIIIIKGSKKFIFLAIINYLLLFLTIFVGIYRRLIFV